MAKRKLAEVVQPESQRTEEAVVSEKVRREENAASDDGDLMDVEQGDDEEWAGIDGQSGVPEPQKVSGSTAVPVRPPNHEELRAIREASDLFKSNTFKLKIDALLPNVRPKESRLPPLENFLRSLHSFLMDLPSTSPENPVHAAQKLQKEGIAVHYPSPLPTEESKWTVTFEKPSSITIVGSWGNNVRVKSKDISGWTVDVAVEMPSNLFQEKDYLDARFFHKRAFYLAHLASKLTSTSAFKVKIQYEMSQLDERLLSIILFPVQDGSHTDFSKLGAHIRLIAYVSSLGQMALRHLSPSHFNIRFKSKGSDATSSFPTPIYNNDMILSSSPRKHLIHHHNIMQEVPSFRDALSLLRVWANQRGYCTSAGNIGCVFGFEGRGYFWPSLLSYLILGDEPSQRKGQKGNSTRKPVGKGLSSYQLFRAALDFLASHDFAHSPVITKGASLISADELKEHHEAVFLDFTSNNVLAGVPLTSLDLLRHDAKLTLHSLNSTITGQDPFSEVFLTDHRNVLSRFDVYIRVDLSKAKLRNSNLSEIVDFGSSSRHLIYKMYSILKRGLADRVRAIAFVTPTDTTRDLQQPGPPVAPAHAEIGLVLDTNQAFRLVERGPPASDTVTDELRSFREFWGEKSELRQFKDGRIEESVVWEAKNTDERAHIPFRIVQHLLKRHFNLGEGDVTAFQNDFDELTRVAEPVAQLHRSSKAQIGFKGALSRFDQIMKTLKAMDDDLPLAVLNVSPVTPHLRYTSAFAPLPLPESVRRSLPEQASFLPCIEAIVQFERSGRWPDDLEAIQKMKLAFYERMGTGLMSRLEGLQARVAVGETAHDLSISDHARLEILTADGWAFALRIWHDREGTLLENQLADVPPALKQLNPNSQLSAVQKRKAQQALHIYVKRFIHSPKHHRTIANLAHLFPAYPGTVRLVKRWLASHWLLGGQVSEEAVELLCASVFLSGKSLMQLENPQSQVSVPGSKELGFFKVMEFLKDWEWENGLFVPLYEGEKATSDEEDENGVSVKAGINVGVWTISTKEDPQGQMWTSAGPDIVSARRIRSIAATSWQCLQTISEGAMPPKTLFLHPTQDYDLLIKIDERALRRQHQKVDGSQNLRLHPSPQAWEIRPDFDPVSLFYQELCRIYAGTLKFFYDEFGGTLIGAVWEPKLAETRPFRVLAGYSSIPDLDASNTVKNGVSLNKPAIVEEIRRIGEGIVKSVVVQR